MQNLQSIYIILGFAAIACCIQYDFDFALLLWLNKVYVSFTDLSVVLFLPPYWYTVAVWYSNALWVKFISLHLFSLFWTNFILTVILSFFFYTKLGLEGFFKINAASVLLFWVFLALEFNYFVCDGGEYTIIFGEFNLVSNCYPVAISLFVDKLSYSFAFLTMSIAVFVFFYTFCYFRYEPSVERLVTLLLLFVNSMILLVLSGNLIVLFLGWELIGVTSFFLINFWGVRINTLKSALKALVFNKVSDSFILASLILIYGTFNTADILVICNSVPHYTNCYVDLGILEVRSLDVISFLLLVAAFIKSAQFGFHLWLPDSMEAPAPASALIHSATLVSAGIFLILRLAPLFELSILAYTVIPAIGAITAFYGGAVSAVQTDVKKILAYSTISHCGFMVLLSATFNLDLVLIYLYVHGFFKALLFLCAGNVMRLFKCQDFRYMGSAYKYLPVECIISIFGFWHLSGGPLSFGYVAKHYIITSISGNTTFTVFLMVNVTLSILASILYSYRFIYFVYFDFKKAKKSVYLEHAAKSLLSSHFTLSTRAGSTILITNYVFVICMCTYLISIWGPNTSHSPSTYCINTSASVPLAEEIVSAGLSIIHPIIIINYVAFIAFWALMFTNFRKNLYPEQDILTLIFVSTLLLVGMTLSITSFELLTPVVQVIEPLLTT